MLDVTHSMMRDIFTECLDRQGWTMPEDMISHCVRVLADHVSRPDWRPKPSYAEQFMTIRTAREAISLGNECWFTRAVFPELMQRRGISPDYYVDMGQSCYNKALQTIENPTLQQITTHFEFTAEIAWTAIHAGNNFRSMWD